jgi:hypothetical protein
MHKFMICSASVLLAMTTGCSIFRSSHQDLSVSVQNPPHAGVWINGNYEGEAPVKARVKRNTSVIVLVKKTGYQSLQRTLPSDLNTTGIFDIIGTYIFLLPVIGVISPGSHSISETSLVLQLAPEENHVCYTNSPVPTNNSSQR